MRFLVALCWVVAAASAAPQQIYSYGYPTRYNAARAINFAAPAPAPVTYGTAIYNTPLTYAVNGAPINTIPTGPNGSLRAKLLSLWNAAGNLLQQVSDAKLKKNWGAMRNLLNQYTTTQDPAQLRANMKQLVLDGLGITDRLSDQQVLNMAVVMRNFGKGAINVPTGPLPYQFNGNPYEAAGAGGDPEVQQIRNMMAVMWEEGGKVLAKQPDAMVEAQMAMLDAFLGQSASGSAAEVRASFKNMANIGLQVADNFTDEQVLRAVDQIRAFAAGTFKIPSL